MAAMDPRRPAATPETATWWEGIAAGELRLQHCSDCARHYFPPRSFCPRCGGRHVEWRKASGRATLYSFVVSHHPTPGFEPPFVIAVVELEEGPRMMTNLVDAPVDPAALPIGMPLEVTFVPLGEGKALPHFRPRGANA